MRRALLNCSEKGSAEQYEQQSQKHLLLFQGMFTALLQEELEGGYASLAKKLFFFPPPT